MVKTIGNSVRVVDAYIMTALVTFYRNFYKKWCGGDGHLDLFQREHCTINAVKFKFLKTRKSVANSGESLNANSRKKFALLEIFVL